MNTIPGSVNVSGRRVWSTTAMTWRDSLRDKLLGADTALPEGPRSAAVSLILRDGKGLEVLLIERVEREGDPWSGQMSLPGGMRGREDDTLSQTSRRETWEEVSIDVEESCALAGRLPELRPGNLPDLVVIPFVYTLLREVSIQCGDEVKDSFWCPLASLKASQAERAVQVRGHELIVPSFLYNDKIIWGLTHRILTSFLGLDTDP